MPKENRESSKGDSNIKLFDEFYNKSKNNTEVMDYYKELESSINIYSKNYYKGNIVSNFIVLLYESEVHNYFIGKYKIDFSNLYLDINNVLAGFSYIDSEKKTKKILNLIESELSKITANGEGGYNLYSGEYNSFYIENEYDDYIAGIQSYYLFIMSIVESHYKTKLFLLEIISKGIKKGKTKDDVLLDLEVLGLYILSNNKKNEH